MKTPMPPGERSSPEPGDDHSTLPAEIEAFLRRQRQGIERLARSAGEAARAEVERAVREALADALRRMAEELPRILAAAPHVAGDNGAADEAIPDLPGQEPVVPRRAGGVSPPIPTAHRGADAPRSPGC